MEEKVYIYMIKNNIFIVENSVSTINHHHHAIKIAINPANNTGILFNGKIVKQNTLIFDADKNHTFDSNSNPVLLLLINPESEFGHTIRKKYLDDDDSYFSDFNYTSDLKEHFTEFIKGPQTRKDVLHFYNDIITCICGETMESFELDERIENAFRNIDALEDKKIALDELALKVYLSGSRFANLFKEETKISLRQYLSWLRLIDALKLIVKGYSFTNASLKSGFTDLPHGMYLNESGL